MTPNRSTRKYFGLFIITWAIINLLLNIIGLATASVASEFREAIDFLGLDSFLWIIKVVCVQTIAFTVVLTVASTSLKQKRLALFSFSILQFVILHAILFWNLFHEDDYYFLLSKSSWTFWYLESSQQALIDLISIIGPLEGDFGESMFMPASIFRFYLGWILFTGVYYVMLTWLTEKALNRIVKKDYV